MSTPMTALAASLAFDQNKVTPGLLGFIVFAALGLATWMLLKSMNKQFKRIDFTEQPEQPEAGAAREDS